MDGSVWQPDHVESTQHGGDGPSVAYLGPEASYTHQAALKYFSTSSNPPTSTPNPNLIPHPTIPSLFHAIQSSTTTYAVTPIENSTNGSVVTTLDLLADTKHQFPNILITGEVFVKVEHALLGFKPTSPSPEQKKAHPDNHTTDPPDLHQITTLYTHPQAWTQCTAFLAHHFPSPPIIYKDVSSTSYAAKLVSQDPSGKTAALASLLAAEVYGLDVLREGIQDVKSGEGNWTRFLVLGRGDGGGGCCVGDDEDGEWKGLVTISPPSPATPSGQQLDSSPVNLNTALSTFSTHDIPITKIESRPSGRKAFDYIYIIEFRVPGGKEGVENVVQGLVGDLRTVVDEGFVRLWGVWRDGWGRRRS